MSSPWFDTLEGIRSRGSQAPRPGSLAGLHEARKVHAGQFFTPPAVVDLMWRIVTPAMDAFHAAQSTYGAPRKLAILDNACGNGRMFWPADPERHVLHGVDIDGDAISQLAAAVDAAGFKAGICNAAMEEVEPGRAHLALINPPFGLTLSSPFLRAVPGITHAGLHGPDTQALSQLYAIAQAVEACAVVLAIVPAGTHAQLAQTNFVYRLRACLQLPRGTFRDEGTQVEVELLVFGPRTYRPEAPVSCRLTTLDDPLPALDISFKDVFEIRAPRPLQIRRAEPYSTLPVTGDRRVRVVHNGRRLGLKFGCALTQAKVMNALLSAFVMVDDKRRLPKGTTYTGQGWLDLENLLTGPNAATNLDTLCHKITAAGGTPDVDPGLANYYRRRLRADVLRRTPFRRWGYIPGTGDLAEEAVGTRVTATVIKPMLIDPSDWNSPMLSKGEPVEIEVTDAGAGRRYAITKAGLPILELTLDAVLKHFKPEIVGEAGWRLIHPGRRMAFPEHAAARMRQAKALGLDALLHWAPGSDEACYQLDDVVELAMAPRGTLGWAPGCGKARAAIALCLMGGRSNAVVVESHLVPEMVSEIRAMGLPVDLWQVISSPEDLQDLRKVNVISYAKLRSPVSKGAGRRTYARCLRRRLNVVVGDEGHVVRNRATAQTQALWMLSAKRRYSMTGTPISNYCRDALPLLIWAGADGTAYQVYGEYQPLVQTANLSSMQYAERGLDAFRDKFVTLEWAVREFDEDLRSGAKREVPRLRSVDDFRTLIAPHILRRVHGEPELARWIKIPVPTRHVHTVAWDKPHLRAYLRTAYEFADWFKRQRESAEVRRGNLNLVSILAHINSVSVATNAPSMLTGPAGAYTCETSKQRFAVDKLKQFVAEGRKSILYATNPDVLEQLARSLDAAGIESVIYSGRQSITARTKALNQRFRHGPAPVLLVGLFCGQTGLNIPQASRVIFYNRAWTPKAEAQAGCRVLRPQQKDEVEFHYLHLEGSMDLYQAMHIDSKQDAIDAGLDFAEQEIEEGEFLHLTTVIGRFCEDLAGRWGLASTHEVMEVLDRAAA